MPTEKQKKEESSNDNELLAEVIYAHAEELAAINERLDNVIARGDAYVSELAAIIKALTKK
jgi:hypothetical protein